MSDDLISRQDAIERATKEHDFYKGATIPTDKARRDELLNVMCWLGELPSAQPVIPHRNYKNCNIYWCNCGWFLKNKEQTPNYCPNCGNRIEWENAE